MNHGNWVSLYPIGQKRQLNSLRKKKLFQNASGAKDKLTLSCIPVWTRIEDRSIVCKAQDHLGRSIASFLGERLIALIKNTLKFIKLHVNVTQRAEL
jgi:hypothetical protein